MKEWKQAVFVAAKLQKSRVAYAWVTRMHIKRIIFPCYISKSAHFQRIPKRSSCFDCAIYDRVFRVIAFLCDVSNAISKKKKKKKK